MIAKYVDTIVTRCKRINMNKEELQLIVKLNQVAICLQESFLKNVKKS